MHLFAWLQVQTRLRPEACNVAHGAGTTRAHKVIARTQRPNASLRGAAPPVSRPRHEPPEPLPQMATFSSCCRLARCACSSGPCRASSPSPSAAPSSSCVSAASVCERSFSMWWTACARTSPGKASVSWRSLRPCRSSLWRSHSVGESVAKPSPRTPLTNMVRNSLQVRMLLPWSISSLSCAYKRSIWLGSNALAIRLLAMDRTRRPRSRDSTLPSPGRPATR
mmetsp:Transcript_79609/g.192899  ORF Transcript_79609/g.192899 Transcript_79609/m.192899 type:complete len:223 (+) Transcript_79609:34-702(+)